MARLEKAYTSAVNRLVARADKEDTITIDKTDGGKAIARVNAGDLAATLIKREVGYRPLTQRVMETSDKEENKMYIAARIGPLLTGRTFLDPGSWTRNFDNDLMVTWTHEAMHTSGVHAQLGDRGTWEGRHDTPYNQAAFRLLGLSYP
ncbi:MAG: hypothetical protein WDO68_16640 [Gammaproteobacteria bacterium]